MMTTLAINKQHGHYVQANGAMYRWIPKGGANHHLYDEPRCGIREPEYRSVVSYARLFVAPQRGRGKECFDIICLDGNNDLTQAGFRSVATNQLAHDIHNNWYVVRKWQALQKRGESSCRAVYQLRRQKVVHRTDPQLSVVDDDQFGALLKLILDAKMNGQSR